jgi:hypothetical protein
MVKWKSVRGVLIQKSSRCKFVRSFYISLSSHCAKVFDRGVQKNVLEFMLAI